MVTHEPDMAAYGRRMVHFLDGRIARDEPNPHPTTVAPPVAAETV
jgi:putative ABC transport system ATP-binding protein